MVPENPMHIEPYKGLRPYEEENRDIFFGRDQEREILIDKLFSNKLTLLFAATGVGKSSLLQAAVMPELRRPERLNLDVAYYPDWVSNPLAGLKQKTLQVLKEEGKVGFDYQIDEGASLKDFFQLCPTFASEPLVVILDQFEEFFQYRRYQEDFLRFVKEFSQCITDRVTPTAFIISMREDFALELNVFKDYLPTTLFENYFRLEKLDEEKARDAISKPVEPFGFHYEEKLLDTLLKDLADREKEARLGTAPVRLMRDMPAYVEPPYLQIVCTQLWEADKQNPDRKICLESYDKKGRAAGFVDSYFNEVMNRFSLSQKKIASLAFDHLVTPRGTKMPYTVKDLSDRIKINEKELEQVLEKLQKSRILRSQKREGVIWYELYHDIFSNIINRWNEKFKTKYRIKRIIKQVIKKAPLVFVKSIPLFLIVFLIYDVISNTTGHYLRLSVKEKISDRIEVYKGKLKTPDIFNLHAYQAETVYQRDGVEPDKLFVKKQIGDFDRLNQELIGHLPLIDRISAYWEAGETRKALALIKNSITEKDMTRSRKVIDLLAGFASIKSYEILKEQLDKFDNIYIRKKIIEALASMSPSLIIEDFIGLLKDGAAEVRSMAVSTLGQIGSEKAVDPLMGLLKDPDSDVRRSTAYALGRLGSEKAVDPLMGLLKNPDPYVRRIAAEALGRLGSEKAVDPLMGLLKDPESYVRRSAAEALGRLGSTKAIEPLASLSNDSEPDVRKNAVLSLGKLSAREKTGVIKNLYTKKNEKPIVRLAAAAILLAWGDETGLEYLKEISKQDNVNRKTEAAGALGEAPSKQGTFMLLKMLDEENIRVKENVILSLVKSKAVSSIPYLHKLIQEPNTRIREAVLNALSGIAAPDSSEPLKKVAVNTGERFSIRVKAIDALAKIQHKDALQDLIELLNNENHIVQYKTMMAIGKNPPSPTIPGDLLDQLKSRLKDKLTGLEKRKARWRKTRDEDTENYNQEQMDKWRNFLKQDEPNEHLEFELAFALSRIDPENEGVELLGHHLANVREGAWMGLGKSGKVSLIDKLYWQRKESKTPWFRHAAYRAIDHILINIDAFGGKEELNRLETLYKNLSEKEGKDFHEGVQTRMEWTIDRLKERVISH